MVNLQTLAAQTVASAKNPDWKDRGALFVGTPRVVRRIALDGRTYREVARGEVTVVAVRFELPLKSQWPSRFCGFFVAIDPATGATKARPIIGDFDEVSSREQEYQWTANELNPQYCPACDGFDTVKTTQRQRGPEFVEVYYRCTKCKWSETDVID